MREKLPLLGRPVEKSWDDLTFVEDIEYYDGPLLLTRRDRDGQLWLWAWTTQDDEAHRWKVLRTDGDRVSAYKSCQISFRELLVPVSGPLYLVDSTGRKHVRTAEVTLEELPEDYLPEEGVGYAADLAPGADDVPEDAP